MNAFALYLAFGGIWLLGAVVVVLFFVGAAKAGRADDARLVQLAARARQRAHDAGLDRRPRLVVGERAERPVARESEATVSGEAKDSLTDYPDSWWFV